MTRSTSTTKHTAAREAKPRPVVPAPRRSPEESHGPDRTAGHLTYPLVRYALDHATALRPRRD